MTKEQILNEPITNFEKETISKAFSRCWGLESAIETLRKDALIELSNQTGIRLKRLEKLYP